LNDEELIQAWAAAPDPLAEFTQGPTAETMDALMDQLKDDPDVAELMEANGGDMAMDAATMVQIMAKPSVQRLMSDPAMARMMQDPLAIEQQIAQLREAANGDKLSQEDGDKVREMLSMQLGVDVDKVDEFLDDLEIQPVDDRTREVLRLFKAMLTGQKVEQVGPPPIDIEKAKASCEELFRIVDRDGDGFINFEELAWLARETGGYVNHDVFQQQCQLVGADAANGLTKEQLLASYVEFGAGDIEVDLAAMKLAAGVA
jgi:hypothetical protein